MSTSVDARVVGWRSVQIWVDADACPQVIKDILTNGLWPKLRDGITSGLAIKLPLPPLGSVASVAPSLAGLTLKTGLNRRVAYRNGFVVLDAKIEAALP